MRVQHHKTEKGAGRATLEALSELGAERLATISSRRKKRGNPLVMIVDDDQISRVLARNVIEKNWDWVCVQDGLHALTEYVINAPDALILDIGLPDINGHEALECIMRIDPEAYVIMLSQCKDEKNVTLSIKEGAQGFVSKPFERKKLSEYMNRSPHLLARKKESPGHAYTAS